MPTLNPNAIITIARKEFADNVRNRWIGALIVIFATLTLVSSYLAGGKSGSSSLGDMEATVLTLISLSSILVPLIAIMLGYSSISGEAESGALLVVLAYPVRRSEILIGKLLGLGSVLVFSTIAGFGLAGIVIAATAGPGNAPAYLAFMGLTILLGMIYLSLSVFFSTLCARRVSSLGAGVILFFWSMIIGSVVFGIYLANGGSMQSLMGGSAGLPGWFWAYLPFSPMDMNQMAVMEAFGISQMFGFSVEAPAYLNLGILVAVQFVWILVPAALSYYFIKKRDF
jgi:Cu-processing system permease protein